MVGKLLPYTLIFVAEALLANMVFFHWEHIPMVGDIGLFALTTVLFIVATQSVAVILYTLFPVLSLVISVVSMVGSLGATLSGLTFPLSAMSPVVQYTAKLFPVRHFTEAMQCIVYFDGGFSDCWPQLVVLCLFPLVMVALLKIRGLPQLCSQARLLGADKSAVVATDALSRRPEEGACRPR
jgi:ABC-2 type transport system permease protein